mmetsp:Transcript_103346/g.316283  ORF Transcript_103346/g.316283 Transcript_103346/m.316283 type:complete len:285 (-) Transcript_103346:94-948(-)
MRGGAATRFGAAAALLLATVVLPGCDKKTPLRQPRRTFGTCLRAHTALSRDGKSAEFVATYQGPCEAVNEWSSSDNFNGTLTLKAQRPEVFDAWKSKVSEAFGSTPRDLGAGSYKASVSASRQEVEGFFNVLRDQLTDVLLCALRCLRAHTVLTRDGHSAEYEATYQGPCEGVSGGAPTDVFNSTWTLTTQHRKIHDSWKDELSGTFISFKELGPGRYEASVSPRQEEVEEALFAKLRDRLDNAALRALVVDEPLQPVTQSKIALTRSGTRSGRSISLGTDQNV